MRAFRRACVLSGAAIACATLMLSVRFAAGPAAACACCASPGTWHEERDKLATFLDELARLRFAPTAHLYTSEGFPDDIKGVERPSAEPYAAAGEISAKAFRLTLKSIQGSVGTISFALPAMIARREIDLPPPPEPGSKDTGDPRFRSGRTNVSLTKEWIISAAPTATGMLAGAGAKGVTARLVLYGTGNHCVAAELFHAWTLVVRGPNVRYSFHGRLLN